MGDLLSWKENLQLFIDSYIEDIPNISGLPAELELWQRLWSEKNKNGEEIPDRISTTLKAADKDAYPNVFAILKVLATIPVTTCSCERSISALRNLKNYLRSTIGQERLNGLALMHVHCGMNPDLEKIVDMFANLHPRRMRMYGILYGND